MNNKEYFKTTSSVQMMANMSLALFIGMITGLVMWLIMGTLPMLILFVTMAVFYVFGFFAAWKSTDKIKGLKLNKQNQRHVENVIKQSRWFLMPFPMVYTIQYLRNIMWKLYSNSKTEGLEKGSEIIKVHLELLEELHADGFVAKMKYDNEKPKLEEQLKMAIAQEAINAAKAKAKAKKKPEPKWD